MLVEFQKEKKNAHEEAASYASEATSAIRTVASLTCKEDVRSHYYNQITGQSRKLIILIIKSSLFYAASRSFQLLAMALGFWYGASLFASCKSKKKEKNPVVQEKGGSNTYNVFIRSHGAVVSRSTKSKGP